MLAEAHTADEILNTPVPSFVWPLAIACKWIQSDDDAVKTKGVELLHGLREKYSHAVEIGQQLALGLIELGQPDEAEKVLAEIEASLGSSDEEILCRMGRIWKDRGDEWLSKPETDEVTSSSVACELYRQALAKYHEAYQIRRGHYPGINEAALLLVLGSLDETRRDECLRGSQDLARELLARADRWPKSLPDDNIWHLATAGEAHLLLHEWVEAAKCYHLAQQETNRQPFHTASMLRQVKRIVSSFQTIGVDVRGRFTNPDGLFA